MNSKLVGSSLVLALLTACGPKDSAPVTGSGGQRSDGGNGATATGATGGGGIAGTAGSGGNVSTAGGAGGGGEAGSGGGGSAGASGGGAGAASTGPVFHVFVLLGQSNMAGNPPAQAADRVEDERIRVLGFDDCDATGRKANEWDVAAPPLHECWADAIGPGDYFAKALIEKLPEGDTIGLVPCAFSGQSVDYFSKGTEKYDWIVERVKNAQQMGGVIDGFLFHQGESDCQSSTWPTRVQKLVEDLKADLDLGDLPFLPGELPYDGQCSAHNSLVQELPDLIPNTHVISAADLKITDIWHFDHHSVMYLGERYEAAMVEALGW